MQDDDSKIEAERWKTMFQKAQDVMRDTLHASQKWDGMDSDNRRSLRRRWFEIMDKEVD